MCLFIDIRAKGISKEKQGLVSKSFDGAKVKLVATRNKGKDTVSYLLADANAGCSCGLLSDDADWGHEIWRLDYLCLPDCSRAIAHLFGSGASELWLTPLWVGDSVNNKIQISRVDLEQAFLQNKLRNFSEYHAT